MGNAADDAVVTVVVPTKNRPELLDAALASVRAQDVGAVEVVVVDDGSDPALAPRIAGVAAAHHAHLLRHETSRGVSAARNAGIAAATGRWVAFLDDDDLWAPTKLARQLAALDGQPDAAWSATACVHVDAALAVTGALAMPAYDGPLHELLLAACWIPAGSSSVLVAADTLRAAGGFVEGVTGCEDWDMWLRLAELAPLAYLDEPLVAYRNWGGNTSADLATMQGGREWVMSRHRPAHPADAPTAAEQVGADVEWHQYLARMHALQGRRRAAAAEYVRARRDGGGWGQLVYAVAALVSPAIVVHRLAHIDAAIDPAWRTQADSWLAPWRA